MLLTVNRGVVNQCIRMSKSFEPVLHMSCSWLWPNLQLKLSRHPTISNQNQQVLSHRPRSTRFPTLRPKHLLRAQQTVRQRMKVPHPTEPFQACLNHSSILIRDFCFYALILVSIKLSSSRSMSPTWAMISYSFKKFGSAITASDNALGSRSSSPYPSASSA